MIKQYEEWVLSLPAWLQPIVLGVMWIPVTVIAWFAIFKWTKKEKS